MINKFKEQGYCIIPKLCSREEAKRLKKSVEEGIRHCCTELDTCEDEYLHAISRWVDPSPVTRGLEPFITKTIQPYLEKIFMTEVVNKKTNVICKTKYASGSVPCHQDIAYSPRDPYEFTIWMPIDDVTCDSGVLQILPGSHFDPIAPAVDFWETDYVDTMRGSDRWQTSSVDLPINAGDAVLFDSRVWHGSAPSRTQSDRFAIVTRWSRKKWVNETKIPDILPAAFGMWTAGKVTEEKLRKYVQAEVPYHEVVDKAIEKIKKEGLLTDCTKAILALKALRILNLAAQKQNGGDAQGNIYREVWNSFLRYLP